ncbi:hypothetical protein GGI22_004221, partial [Coemansia erecta]
MQHQHITFNVQDVGQIWPRIENDFRSRLPLRNLIWKGGITQTPRFVEQLSVKVTVDGEHEGTSDSDSSSKEIMSATMPSLSTNPLLNIYLLETLDTDALDMYKSVIRPRVKNWVSKVSQRKGEEWVIIYFPNAAEVQRMATTTKFLNMRASVFDKLKSDFQTKKDADHVIMLRPDMIESWNTLFLTLRDRTVQALEERVGSMADEIRRLDSNRMMPGWNYCKFFIVKEGLVNMYRLMGLNSEALAQYDELEAVYFELLGSRRLSWFSKFGGTQPGDDFADLLNDKKKPYHKQMAESSITMFDFRIYLFGRQCQLLIDMSDYNELIGRAQQFVSSFSKSMREPGTGLSLSFVASWTYSICQNIVEICEGIQVTQAPVDRSQGYNAGTVATTRMLSASKAEFLTSARQQLDILGTLYDRLPPKYLRRSNTCIQLPSPLLRSPSESVKAESGNEKDNGAKDMEKRYGSYTDAIDSITNPVLTEALASDERFDQIYVRTCEQATQYYLECGRQRFAQVMRGDIAQLFISREQWKDAARVLAPLIPSTEAKSLGIMDVHLVERMAICEQHLGNTEKCLDYVVCLVSHSQYLDSSSRNMYADMLVDLASTLQSPIQVGSGASMLFSINDVKALDREDTLCVAVSLVSVVPKPVMGLKIEALLLAGSGVEGNQIEVLFDASDVALEPGTNTVHLTTDSVSCPGRFVVRSVTIRMANLIFPVIVSNPNARKFVRLNEHPTAPTISLQPASVFDSTKPSGMRLSIQTRTMAVDAAMSIWLFDDNGRLLLKPRSVQEIDGIALVKEDGVLVVSEPIEANSTVELSIMLSKQYSTMRVTVYAEFQIQGQPRMLLDSDVVDFTPRIAISGYVEMLAEKHVVVLRAQSHSIDPVRLDSFRMTGDSKPSDKGLWEKMAAKRGFLQLGDCTTLVREYPVAACNDVIEIQAEAAFVTTMDIVSKMVRGKLDQLASKHDVSHHKRYIERLITAHIRATMDEVATVQEMKLACDPLVPLWAAASMYGTTELQRSMHQLFQELSATLVGGELTTGERSGDGPETGSNSRVLRARLALGVTRKYAAVSMSLGNERFCHVFEPAPLTVSVELVVAVGPDAGEKPPAAESRLLVTL